MKLLETMRVIFLLTLICIVGSGCGGSQVSDQPDLGTVTGTVTMDGTALPGAMVIFSPEKGRSSMGTTDSEGKYEMIYVGDTKGAKLGNHKISITTVQEGNSEESGEETATTFKETIPAKYNTKTTLTEIVKEGDNVFDFELTSK
ncbi:carboxypeptidase regulatory-like domain-containing protein [Gimesia aquarii]|uniref:Carboxypeptidase regulatory-like domain-containing protein n=1 Tax=Gimesia aquarii TaxID=2527964 RepID=A0A517WUM1_9PLAN|nr:carboxypeptidase regulatory-like domain-containing protein [Gimesia aquarii]QDU08970.1 hypothetical protein V202x_23400 [Gimesia aquarii]